MTVLLAPDKFKGSLTAREVCEALTRGLLRARPELDVLAHPMADGGDGSLAVLRAHRPLTERRIATTDPLGRPIQASYFVDVDGAAYVELPAASGLVLLAEGERDPLATTTLGTGTLVADAIARGARCVYLFLGGSATNDAGMGIAVALGLRFFDASGHALAPCGKALIEVDRMDLTNLIPWVREMDFRILVDVSNPLYGPTGAAHAFARQKGADAAAVELLDAGLRRFAGRLTEATGVRVDELAGGGAAGGIAAGLAALFGARVEEGFGYLAEATGLAARIATADVVVTGEGRLDATSLGGKVVGGVARLCREAGKPLHAVAGAVALTAAEREVLRLRSVHAVMDRAADEADAMGRAGEILKEIGVELGGRLPT